MKKETETWDTKKGTSRLRIIRDASGVITIVAIAVMVMTGVQNEINVINGVATASSSMATAIAATAAATNIGITGFNFLKNKETKEKTINSSPVQKANPKKQVTPSVNSSKKSQTGMGLTLKHESVEFDKILNEIIQNQSRNVIITGKFWDGKTTLLNYIEHMDSDKIVRYIKEDTGMQSRQTYVKKETRKWFIGDLMESKAKENALLLLVDEIDRLDEESAKELFVHMRNLYTQVIITGRGIEGIRSKLSDEVIDSWNFVHVQTKRVAGPRYLAQISDRLTNEDKYSFNISDNKDAGETNRFIFGPYDITDIAYK